MCILFAKDLQRCTMAVEKQFDIVEAPEQYELTDFTYKDLKITEREQ